MRAAVDSSLLARRAACLRRLRAAERLNALVVTTRGHISQYGDVEFLCGYAPVSRAAYGVLGRYGARALIVPTPADRWYATRLADPVNVRVTGEGNFVSAADAIAAETAAAVRDLAGDGGRVAIVTGAGQGLGAAIAAELAVRGARVVLADVNAPSAREQAATIGCGATAAEVDVADFGAVQRWSRTLSPATGASTCSSTMLPSRSRGLSGRSSRTSGTRSWR